MVPRLKKKTLLDMYFPEDVQNVCFTTHGHKPELVIARLNGKWGVPHIGFEQISGVLELDETQKLLLIKRVLQSTLARWTKGKLLRPVNECEWRNTLAIARKYFGEKDSLYLQLQLKGLRYFAPRIAHPRVIIQSILPQPIPPVTQPCTETALHPSSMQDVIEYLLSCGNSPEDIRTTISTVIQTVQESGVEGRFIVELLNLTIAGEPLTHGMSEVAARSFKQEFKRAVKERFSVDKTTLGTLHGLLEKTDADWRQADTTHAWFKKCLVHCIANKKQPIARTMLLEFAPAFGLEDSNEVEAWPLTQLLIRRAVEVACKNYDFAFALCLTECVEGFDVQQKSELKSLTDRIAEQNSSRSL